jgi:hypothetical protein
MSYETATATDVADLLGKFRVFLLAAGWTVDFWGDAGAGKALSVSRDGRYWTLLTDPSINSTSSKPGPYLSIVLHTSFGGGGTLAQPNASVAVVSNRLTGPMQSYRFFAGAGPGGAYAHMVVETDPGTYRHIGIGALRTMGAVENGAYAFASNWDFNVSNVSDAGSGQHGMPWDDQVFAGGPRATVFRADYDGVSPRYHYVGQYSADRARGGWRNDTDQYSTILLPAAAGASTITGRTPLLPLWVAVDRGSSLWTDVGFPPDMRFVRMDNLTPGEELPAGPDTWIAFPVARKSGAAGLPNSGIWGYAYRKVL